MFSFLSIIMLLWHCFPIFSQIPSLSFIWFNFWSTFRTFVVVVVVQSFPSKDLHFFNRTHQSGRVYKFCKCVILTETYSIASINSLNFTFSIFPCFFFFFHHVTSFHLLVILATLLSFFICMKPCLATSN